MDFKSTILNRILDMNKRKLGIILIIVIVAVLILFPFIDTNFFYAKRIKNRIDILQKITELDKDKINQDQNLAQEYNNIIKEINESDSNYINKVLNNNKREHTIGKFISGGVIWWLLGFMVLFFYNSFNKDDTGRGKKNWGTRVGGFILCALVGLLFGLVCSIVPTIVNVWVNYIVVPILMFVFMILLLNRKNTKSDK